MKKKLHVVAPASADKILSELGVKDVKKMVIYRKLLQLPPMVDIEEVFKELGKDRVCVVIPVGDVVEVFKELGIDKNVVRGLDIVAMKKADEKDKSNEFPIIDKTSWFYKNCKQQRKREAKICQCCPFRKGIELQEMGEV